MISARECIFVVLKSRMNSVRHSLNSESTLQVSISNITISTTALTNDWLKTVLPVNGKTSLTRQLDRIHNVNAHLNHALHHHVVFLELWASQHCMLNTYTT